jgi:hypothetical protein
MDIDDAPAYSNSISHSGGSERSDGDEENATGDAMPIALERLSDPEEQSEEDEPSLDEEAFEEALSENAVEAPDIREQLRCWAVKNVTHAKVDELLGILRPMHPGLPARATDLLGTPRVSMSVELGDGRVVHFGLGGLEQKLSTAGPHQVLINVDGMPLFKSPRSSFWVVQARLANDSETDPVIVSLFYGPSEPQAFPALLNSSNLTAPISKCCFNAMHLPSPTCSEQLAMGIARRVIIVAQGGSQRRDEWSCRLRLRSVGQGIHSATERRLATIASSSRHRWSN